MNSVTLKKLEFDRVADHAACQALSPMGRDRLLESAPFHARDLLLEELEKVLELKNMLQKGDALPFSFLPDTRPHLKKLEILESCLEPEELQDVFNLLHASAELRKFMSRNRELYRRLNDLTTGIWLERSLQGAIRTVIDEQGNIRDTASDALNQIRRELGERRELIRRKMERLLRHCSANGWLMEDVVAVKNGRLTLGLKIEYKHKLNGYIQDYSGTGQTVFIEPADTLEISNRVQHLQIAERREIDRILREVSGKLRSELENIRHNENLLGEFDSIYARGRFALEVGGVLPAVSDGHTLRIIKGYHPWLLISHRDKKVVPLDLDLEENEKVLVISGPNAGGKTVAMKTAGLLCCMLLHGYLPPCSESSVFPCFGDIFIEIGDDQSIENDLSTFSSHLGEIRKILEAAGPFDLVLIDELCAGTDVEEGGAIARVIFEELLARGCKAVVTTHIGELKAYAHEREGVLNGAMEFDRTGLQPTFRFIKGLPGNSFAFAMMKRMGFSLSMVERAAAYMKGERLGLDRMLDDLRSLLEENRQLRRTLGEERSALDERERSVTEEESMLAKKQRELRLGVSREIMREVEHARREIRTIVQDVKKAPADEGNVREARRKLGEKLKEADRKGEAKTEERALVADLSIREGDLVRFLDSSATGEVESTARDTAVVRCGNFRLTTSLRNLEKISRKQDRKLQRDPAEPAAKKTSWSVTSADFESTRLDLRGLMGDEAIMKIDRFIDSMRLGGIRSGTIVHGKGTGSLRQRTAEFLQQHPSVKNFRLGEWDEGGTGVTVVELK
ncbi:MAG: endonuclease MutS2 [Chlorobiaceae bacterium]|nr:endonuclease MutS2 [Chlorobiaceae bacterium]NTV59828.1 endonuclease MutS2 [Chlorobiaceae bacterium]